MPALPTPTRTIPTDPLALLTVEEAANLRNCSLSEIYRDLREGKLLAVRFGRALRVRRTDLERCIDEHTKRYVPCRYRRDFKANPIRPSAAKRCAG